MLGPVTMTIYKAFVRSHLDYCDTTYGEADNETFDQKLLNKMSAWPQIFK